MPDSDVMIGQTFLNRYKIESRIGAGYTSVTYKAHQRGINQPRVIKILKREHSNNRAILAQLKREEARQSELTHRNIVKILDFGSTPDGLPFVIQEYVDNGNLRDYLESGKKISADDVLQIMDDVTSALDYMYRRSLMHLDIKPENILVSSDGSFRLADFGLVKKKGRRGETPVAGTPDYMHPDFKELELIPRRELKFAYDSYPLGRLIQLDLMPVFVKTAPADQVEFLTLIMKRATDVEAGCYANPTKLLWDLDNLRNRYVPSTSVQEFASRTSFVPTIRIPPEITVRVTDRVLNLIANPWFQRLRGIRQLGPIALVYPGAAHSRFEHSLGCFHQCRRYLEELLKQSAFRDALDSEKDVLALLAAALLHDVGHYPFSHAVEEAERRLIGKGRTAPRLRHETLARWVIQGKPSKQISEAVVSAFTDKEYGTLWDQLLNDWGVDPDVVCRLIANDPEASDKEVLLNSIINGPIDADKMDYLERDSVHLGVPYGRYIDKERFFLSLTMNEDKTAIGLTDKGRIAAESFIFSRYAMTSEVYWHHAARAASAMIVQAMEILLRTRKVRQEGLLTLMFTSTDDDLLTKLAKIARGTEAHPLLLGLSSPKRRVYKRLATYSPVYYEDEKKEIYNGIRRIAQAGTLQHLQSLLNRSLVKLASPATPASGVGIIIDVPPEEEDTQELCILYPKAKPMDKRYYKLSTISDVPSTLGLHVERNHHKIRVFCDPALEEPLIASKDRAEELIKARVKQVLSRS